MGKKVYWVYSKSRIPAIISLQNFRYLHEDAALTTVEVDEIDDEGLRQRILLCLLVVRHIAQSGKCLAFVQVAVAVAERGAHHCNTAL